MKSKILLCIILATVGLSGKLCGLTKEKPIYDKPIVEVKGVKFGVDPRIELFHTLEILQGIPYVNFVEIDYKQKIINEFKPYKNLPIFDYLSKNPIYGSIFNTIDGPIWFLLHLTEDLEWRESMKAQAYHSWESVIKEQLTESIACRMAATRFGDDVANLNYLRYQKGKDWMYITPIMKSLEKYEQNREQYPTLKSFMPVLLSDLQKITDSNIEKWANEAKSIRMPETNTIPIIDDIYSKDSVLFIVSTRETDYEAHDRLQQFIKSIRDRLFENAEIVADTTALKMDLSKYHLSVWGTPEGNLFLNKYLNHIPVMIKQDKVVAENEYQGTGYGMLISWPNPLNTKNTMAIYTAQNPQTLVDFNRIMNGAGNYHIFNNFISLKVGEFKKLGGVWLAK